MNTLTVYEYVYTFILGNTPTDTYMCTVHRFMHTNNSPRAAERLQSAGSLSLSPVKRLNPKASTVYVCMRLCSQGCSEIAPVSVTTLQHQGF